MLQNSLCKCLDCGRIWDGNAQRYPCDPLDTEDGGYMQDNFCMEDQDDFLYCTEEMVQIHEDQQSSSTNVPKGCFDSQTSCTSGAKIQ